MRSAPTRRDSLHFGPMYLAMFSIPYLSALHAAALGSAAAVVRDRRDVGDVGDLEAGVVQRTHGGFAARAGALDQHFERLDAVLGGDRRGLLGGDLRGERGRLARALEAARAGRGP